MKNQVVQKNQSLLASVRFAMKVNSLVQDYLPNSSLFQLGEVPLLEAHCFA